MNNGTSIVYIRDQKKFTDMAKFIKKLGDERLSCKVEFKIDSIELRSQLMNKDLGPLQIQLVRGPLKSETKLFKFDTEKDKQTIELGYTFQRLTTLYKTQNSQLQTKSLLIRLLEIS